MDDTVGFDTPRKLNPEVKVRTWKEVQPDETHHMLFNEYETPEGTLRQVVRRTIDWPFGDDIPIFTDYVVPTARSKKYLIEGVEDLKALSSLFSESTEEELKPFFAEAERVKGFAEAHGVLVECGMFVEVGWKAGLYSATPYPGFAELRTPSKPSLETHTFSTNYLTSSSNGTSDTFSSS